MGDGRISWRTAYSTEAHLQKTLGGDRSVSWHVTFQVANLKGGGSGNFTLLVQPHWAPVGARRFRRLVEERFYEGSRFFRVLNGFVAQFGLSGDPRKDSLWQYKTIADDIVKVTNKRGRVSFAASGTDSRTTQVFVNLGDNRPLDKDGALGGFAPFAEVIAGMDTIDRLYSDYGEGAPSGHGPDQRQIVESGNRYLEAEFPKLSYIEALDFEYSDQVGTAAQEEDLTGVANRLAPLKWLLPVFAIALFLLVRVFCKVYRRFAEDDEEEGRRRKGVPSPQKVGAGPLE